MLTRVCKHVVCWSVCVSFTTVAIAAWYITDISSILLSNSDVIKILYQTDEYFRNYLEKNRLVKSSKWDHINCEKKQNGMYVNYYKTFAVQYTITVLTTCFVFVSNVHRLIRNKCNHWRRYCWHVQVFYHLTQRTHTDTHTQSLYLLHNKKKNTLGLIQWSKIIIFS